MGQLMFSDLRNGYLLELLYLSLMSGIDNDPPPVMLQH